MKKDTDLLCPSYVCKPGAKLFGVINSDGYVDYLKSAIEINETFVEEAHKGREPEKRFRFAGNCSKNGCNQWDESNNQCGLVNTIIQVKDNNSLPTLQKCAIREKCRWYLQRKESACYNCTDVIRNIEIKKIAEKV